MPEPELFVVNANGNAQVADISNDRSRGQCPGYPVRDEFAVGLPVMFLDSRQ